VLKEKFGAFGEVGDVYIPRRFGSTDPRGFAFVRFMDKQAAEDAMRALDSTMIEGREIRIQEAKERRPDNPRSHMASRE
jgi:RNA recognition motif-containing protein